MPRKTMDFDTVRESALALPGVEQSCLHGAPTVKVCGRLLACPALHKSAEANSLVVRVGVEQRAALLAHDPNVFYVMDHYISYPSILVRLDRIDAKALRQLLEMGWRFVTSSAKVWRGTKRYELVT
jgi:hypothetical protein